MSRSTSSASHRGALHAVTGLLVAGLSLASTEAARAQDPQDGGSADVRVTCLENHEKSQVLRYEGKLLEARDVLRGCSQDACPPAIRSDCTAWLEQVQLAMPSVVFTARTDEKDRTEVKVFMNDKLITEKLDGKPLPVDPGAYDMRFEVAGEKPLKMRVVIREGEQNRVIAAEWKKEPPPGSPGYVAPPKDMYRPTPKPVFVLAGVSALSLGAGVFFAVKAKSSHTDATDSCAPSCSEDEVKKVRTKAAIADALFGTAILSGIATGIVYATRPEVERPPTLDKKSSVSLMTGPESFLLQLKGRF
jgi:hypothetical protein